MSSDIIKKPSDLRVGGQTPRVVLTKRRLLDHGIKWDEAVQQAIDRKKKSQADVAVDPAKKKP